MSNYTELLSRGNALIRRRVLDGARAALEKAARQQKGRAEPWISLAAVHGMSGDYDSALRCARKASELAPFSLQAWINLELQPRSAGIMIRPQWPGDMRGTFPDARRMLC